ncbi:MAG: type II toxin-antitoxin system prevent-host-death family antitoxin [Planctomycetaceae bacterium]
MKTIKIEDTGLAAKYVSQAQRENVVLTDRGNPVVVLVGIRELDEEQIELGLSDDFWKMIVERRKQPTISHEEMKRRLGLTSDTKPSPRSSTRKVSTRNTTKAKKAVVK